MSIDDYSNRNKIAMFRTLLQMESDTYKYHSSDFIDTHSVLLPVPAIKMLTIVWIERKKTREAAKQWAFSILERFSVKDEKQATKKVRRIKCRKMVWLRPDDNNHRMIGEYRLCFAWIFLLFQCYFVVVLLLFLFCFLELFILWYFFLFV